MSQFTPEKFVDFFKHYQDDNPKHRAAALELGQMIQALCPTLLRDESNWVRIYRQPWQDPQAKGASAEAVRKPTTGRINWNDMSCPVSKYFTVAEVTQGDRRRIPQPNSQVEKSILTLAAELDQVREAWGSAIGVTSWYRPPAINAAVGGVSNSQHINGGAADIYTLDGRDREFENWLDKVAWKDRALGYGVAAGLGFTHVDLREGYIRWTY